MGNFESNWLIEITLACHRIRSVCPCARIHELAACRCCQPGKCLAALALARVAAAAEAASHRPLVPCALHASCAVQGAAPPPLSGDHDAERAQAGAAGAELLLLLRKVNTVYACVMIRYACIALIVLPCLYHRERRKKSRKKRKKENRVPPATSLPGCRAVPEHGAAARSRGASGVGCAGRRRCLPLPCCGCGIVVSRGRTAPSCNCRVGAAAATGGGSGR